MQRVTQIMLLLFLNALALAASAEEQNIVEGVYHSDLTIYTKEGKRRDDLAEAYKNIADGEIAGTTVLDRTPRNLVKLHFRGNDIWVRSSQLKLSMKKLIDCPDATPADKYDRQTPIASGMGPECESNNKK